MKLNRARNWAMTTMYGLLMLLLIVAYSDGARWPVAPLH